MKVDILVVGAGFAGSVAAQRLADAGKRVLVIDKRQHIGGNAYDEHDDNGILIHQYGPHIMHTNNKRVWTYLSQFTEWLPYEHLVIAEVNGTLIPLPFNLNSIYALFPIPDATRIAELLIAQYGLDSTVPVLKLRHNDNDRLSSLGDFIYMNVFYHYTKKQWGVAPEDLDPGVTARVPVRINRDNRYFQDKYQGMPSQGYTSMFKRILDNPNIDIRLEVDYSELKNSIKPAHIIYTGPIDEYYEYCYGKLPYRSVYFDIEHIPTKLNHQPVGVVNYPNNHEYTRITEFKHLTGQIHDGTTIAREYSSSEGDPYYPVPNPENALQYKRYETLAHGETNVTFIGRLAEYRYYNIDQVVDAALTRTDNLIWNLM